MSQLHNCLAEIHLSQDRLCFLTKPEIDALKKENNVNKDKIVLGYAGRLIIYSVQAKQKILHQKSVKRLLNIIVV